VNPEHPTRVAQDSPELPIHPRPEGAEVGDLSPETFRTWAHTLSDWMADYLAQVESYPVLAQVEPGALRAALPPRAPEAPESMEAVFQDFQSQILPGITHWNHPSFHGYFAVTGSAPGILGEMLAATLNVNAMVWRSSPAGTELEALVADWLRDLMGLPEGFLGVIQDTASSSSMVGLAGARQAAYPEVRTQGLFGLPPGRIYASTEAHSSIDKAVITLGFGHEALRKIPVDAHFRMDVAALERALEEDVEAGFRPVAIVATLGSTSTTSVDPMAEIAAVARKFGVWLHVDAAYGGAAATVPELRALFQGWEAAQSIVVNPHKWLFTPMDCSLLYMSDPERIREAFSVLPEYLRTPASEAATQLMDYGPALGRRFRALKLWFVMRAFGAEGVRERVREHIRLARDLAREMARTPGWELVAPVPFSTVVFRRQVDGDAEAEARVNLAIMDAVNASGEAFLSHTKLNGRVALRLAIGNLKTEPRHLDHTWGLLQEVAAHIERGARGR
jgi:aromatic-L-amino-acid/L-tryptophan decarboxylase